MGMSGQKAFEWDPQQYNGLVGCSETLSTEGASINDARRTCSAGCSLLLCCFLAAACYCAASLQMLLRDGDVKGCQHLVACITVM